MYTSELSHYLRAALGPRGPRDGRAFGIRTRLLIEQDRLHENPGAGHRLGIDRASTFNLIARPQLAATLAAVSGRGQIEIDGIFEATVVITREIDPQPWYPNWVSEDFLTLDDTVRIGSTLTAFSGLISRYAGSRRSTDRRMLYLAMDWAAGQWSRLEKIDLDEEARTRLREILSLVIVHGRRVLRLSTILGLALAAGAGTLRNHRILVTSLHAPNPPSRLPAAYSLAAGLA